MSQAIYRKYRPAVFADVTGQDHVISTLLNQINNGAVSHAYLFTGPRGIGKTTAARLLAKAINCENSQAGEPCNQCPACLEIAKGACLDVIEIDAASHTDVENVRENIVKAVRFSPNRLKYKVFVIDEVHMLSASSFNALLKTLEEPPAHGIFILATTEIHKVPATIISRCQRFDFRRIPVPALVERLDKIAKQEGIKVEDGVLEEVARRAEGCARDAESLLDQILSLASGKTISREAANLVLPAVNTILVADFLLALARRQAREAIAALCEYAESGVDLPQLAQDTIEFLRVLLLEKMSQANRLEASLGADAAATAHEILAHADQQFITRAIEAFLAARRNMKTDKLPQLSLELAVLDIVGENEQLELGNPAKPASPPADQKSDFKEKGAPLGSVNEPLVRNDREQKPDPIEAKETVFDSVPVIDLNEVKKKWPDVFQKLKECNASLPLMIQSGELSAVNGDQVEITFEYGLYAETVNRDKNKRLIEQAMEKVMGRTLRVRARHENPKADPAISDLLDQFGGSVI